MTNDTIGEIWSELKRYINTVDRSDAADTMVAVLIDNDYTAEDIRVMFRGDADIKQSLTQYLDNDRNDDEEEDNANDSDEDEDW